MSTQIYTHVIRRVDIVIDEQVGEQCQTAKKDQKLGRMKRKKKRKKDRERKKQSLLLMYWRFFIKLVYI